MDIEVVNGPDGEIVVPRDLESIRADGFMLRLHDDNDIVLDVIGSTEQFRRAVLARLEFTGQGFASFLEGLAVVSRDTCPPMGAEQDHLAT